MKKLHTTTLFALAVLFSCTPSRTFYVEIRAPQKLKKYLVETQTENKTWVCSLQEDFSKNDIEPFITALAAMPSDVDGDTAKKMLGLLCDWISADNESQIPRFNAAMSCMKKVNDPDAHEELSYWLQKWSAIFAADNIKHVATALDGLKYLPVPEEWSPYIQRGNEWALSEEFVLDDVPGFIYALASLPPNKYDTREHITSTGHALSSLCEWVLSADQIETCQERLTAIKNGIEQLITPSTKQEISYWFKKVLSVFLLNTHTTTETAELLLANGAYIKSSCRKGLTLFYYSFLNDALYARLCDAGVSPQGTDCANKRPPILYAISNQFDLTLDTYLRRDANIHFNCADGSNCCMHEAIIKNNLYALRKLLHKGIDINRTDNNGKTLLDYLMDKGAPERKKAFYMLMGQQPSKIPQQAIPAIGYDPAAYNDLLKIKDHGESKKLRKWLYANVNYKNMAAPCIPLYCFGSPQKLKKGIPRIIKNFVRLGKMLHPTPAKDIDRHIYNQYAFCCVEALEAGAEIGFLNLLTICAQQRIAERWMLEKERITPPSNQLIPYKEAQSHLFKAFKKYPWIHEIPGINTVFTRVDVLDNLYKIVSWDVKKYGRPNELPGTKKALKGIEDLKVIFN